MVQAKMAARSAKLSLLPHLSFSSAANLGAGIATMDPFAALGVAGDFVPFLFPAKIIDAMAQKWQYKAEEMVYTLMRANIAVSVEQMAVNYVHQRTLLMELQKLVSEARELFSLMKDLEARELIPEGSSDHMAINLDDLYGEEAQVAHALSDQARSLSLMLGFNNPNIVKDIVLDNNISTIESILAKEKVELITEQEEYARYAIQNSFEIRQQDFLEKAAKDKEKEVFLTWLNPDGGGAPLGLNLIADHKAAHSVLRSIKITTQKLRQELKSRAYALVEERNVLKQAYPKAEDSLRLRKKMWQEFRTWAMDMKTRLDAGEKLDTSTFGNDPTKDLMDDLQNGLNVVTSFRTVIAMDQAELDRMALRGPFQMMLPHLKKARDHLAVTAPLAEIDL